MCAEDCEILSVCPPNKSLTRQTHTAHVSHVDDLLMTETTGAIIDVSQSGQREHVSGGNIGQEARLEGQSESAEVLISIFLTNKYCNRPSGCAGFKYMPPVR